MRITASHIIHWVENNTKVAQTDLPRWVRRLCFSAETTREIAFPAGDSSFVPGWDGVLSCERDNAWVPTGASRWEIGCNQDIQRKANDDYLKRTTNTIEPERLACTFVFVTPRRWQNKKIWLAQQLAKKEWAEVRAYDADDLEQWLEQSPAIALQFGEQIGLLGAGVESCGRHWKSWSEQCQPAITSAAMVMGRSESCAKLNAEIERHVADKNGQHFLTLRADSVQEAAALAVATILATGQLADTSLVVTNIEGWRYVEVNLALRVVVAASPEVAQNPVLRPGLLLIVPHAVGNLPRNAEANELVIERPHIYEFEQALITICIEESDARRLALSTGRSWSVLRRQRAKNSAIAHPAWLSVAQSASLAMLCLLGTWNASEEADRQVVARLANRPYEDIESDLQQLAQLDDAPILCIGAVWKVKSPMELLGLFGERITTAQLDRFFAIALEMLQAPDPQLELPEEQRWAAQFHGKVQPYSGLLFDSICDALIKLAVRGPEQAHLRTLRIEDRVGKVVFHVLDSADATRWLSLASCLPALAEAAPDKFLTAIEKSLRLPDAPVTRLLTETTHSGGMGRCWHAGLLWALETIAWDGRWLSRVALILAQLSHIPLKGNWGNKPNASLFGLFRSWFPQTAASLQGRIKVLDLLIKRDEEVAFDLILGLLPSLMQEFASPAARPKWREDDAGTRNGVSFSELDEMHQVAKSRILQLSQNNASRIIQILRVPALRNSQDREQVFALIAPFQTPSATDEDKEILRTALRGAITWHRNYDDSPQLELDAQLVSLDLAYAALAPTNLVFCHRWLFAAYWIEMPVKKGKQGYDENLKTLNKMRASALTEIFNTQGWAGIEQLINECAAPETVGHVLADLALIDDDWPTWIVTKGGDFAADAKMTMCIRGLLGKLQAPKSIMLTRAALAIGTQMGWDVHKQVRLLLLLRMEQETWQLVAENGGQIETQYWQLAQPAYSNSDEDLNFVLQKLLLAERARTALWACCHSTNPPDTQLLFLAFQHFVAGQEPNGPLIDSWHYGELLEKLQHSTLIDKAALMRLEFALLPALGYGEEGRAVTLYENLMSEPKIFAELICLVFRPRHREPDDLLKEEITELDTAIATNAFKVLHACKRLPGITADGSIDPHAFATFIDTARELCAQADRLAVADSTLGEILAHAPADEDETWPCAAVREILDRPELDDLRNGFATGTLNKRGVTCRSPLAGGAQERSLANYFSDQARRVQHSHTNVATMLEGLAMHYIRYAEREDDEANLRKEGY